MSAATQKILKRVAALNKYELRKRAAQKHLDFKAERGNLRRQMKGQRELVVEQLVAARDAQREDWKLGPLAPNRHFGKDGETFGGIDREAVTPLALPKPLQRKHWAIAEGDRVVLLKGVDKGKIGVVKQLHKEEDHITVDGLNMAYQKKPELFMKLDGDTTRISPSEVAVKYDDVRLVWKLKDKRTGETRDIIVEELELMRRGGNKEGDKRLKEGQQFCRYIKGTRIILKWPRVHEPEYETYEDDTMRISVDEQTFVPTLLTPPMPTSVIDELRGKYSKFRTRHEEEYLAKLDAREQAKDAKNNWASTMKMPIQLLHEQQRAEKEKRGRPELSEDMLARIGEVMAANQQMKRLQA